MQRERKSENINGCPQYSCDPGVIIIIYTLYSILYTLSVVTIVQAAMQTADMNQTQPNIQNNVQLKTIFIIPSEAISSE